MYETVYNIFSFRISTRFEFFGIGTGERDKTVNFFLQGDGGNFM